MIPGTVLSERYMVGKVVETDQTAVTYIAWDKDSNFKVKVKEYFPVGLVTRVPESTFVLPSDNNLESSFDEGFRAFVDEAKRIYREGGSIKLYDCIAENNTAYMIMEWQEKKTPVKPVARPVQPQQRPPVKTSSNKAVESEKKKQDIAVLSPEKKPNHIYEILRKISLIPMWLKILVPVLLVAIVVAIIVFSSIASGKNKNSGVAESVANTENTAVSSETESAETEATTVQTSETTTETQPNAEWRLIDDEYYLYIDDVMATGWVSNEGHMYYLNPENGTTMKGWQEIDGSWYYFCKAGYIVTGWQQIDDLWFYFNMNGNMLTGWQQIEGSWFYFEDNGTMLTGFQEMDGNTYYFDPNGHLRVGWMKIDDEMYFFDKDGIMFTGTRIINGTTFEFDDDGRCLNPPD